MTIFVNFYAVIQVLLAFINNYHLLDTWPRRKDGHHSTSGTTATVVILREKKIFIGHVGDSAAAIAQKKNNRYVAQELTVDHKPESALEKTRY